MFLGTLSTSVGTRVSKKCRCCCEAFYKRTALGQLDKVKLLAFLWPSHMRRDKGVHEGLKVGPPPLGQAIANLPVSRLLTLADAADGGEALVEAGLEPFDLVVLGAEVVAGELEEGVCDLQHEDVRVVVLMADEDALAGAAHAVLGVVLLEALEAGDDGRVLLGLGLLDAEGVVGERVEADRVWLV